MLFFRFIRCLIVLIGFNSVAANAQSIENIHLHIDKDIYLPGETIWFKAYLYSNNSPAAVSTNFYIGLYDHAGNLLEEKKYPIIDASCHGDFTLSDTVDYANARIRAFTKANRLFDSSYFFEKQITVRSREKHRQENSISADNFLQVDFFPESGNFVAGISNFLAFKASYADGRPALISGVIKDELNKTVTDTFATTSLGLGKIQFTPNKENRYTALWSVDGNKWNLTVLPEVQHTGIALHTELVENTVHYLVKKNSESGNLQTLHLLAQMGDVEMYKADLLIGTKAHLINKFAVDSMPAGILQFTLFDDNWQPVAQRILYINPNEPPAPAMVFAEKSVEAKGKNIIVITLPDSGFNNLSASIADINFYNIPNKHSIKKSLLFSPLKNLNTIYSSALEHGSALTADLILLTHNWKKQRWQNIINNLQQPTKPVDDYLSLTVNYYEKNKRLAQKTVLNLIINDKITGKQFFNLLPDIDNTFKKGGLIFYDSARVYFGIKNEKETLDYLSAHFNENFEIAKYIEPQKNISWRLTETLDHPADFIDSVLNRKPKKFNEEQTLKGIAVKSRVVNPESARMAELDKKYTSGMFGGMARGYQFNLLDDKSAAYQSDVLNYLVFRAGGLKIQTGAFGERFLLNSRTSTKLIAFIDEVELPEQEGLSNIPVSQIAYIKYVPGIVIGSSFVSDAGALYIYRKKGDELDPSTATFRSVKLKGYNLPKYFENPDYSEKAALLQSDYRTTLYWNPYLSTEKDNRTVKIEYYNNDISKKILLIVEGIDASGNLIHYEKLIEN